jgi:hypothetical protein
MYVDVGPTDLIAVENRSHNIFKAKLSDSHMTIGTMACSVRAGINPTPTQQVKQRLVEVGFTPARIGVGTWKSLKLGTT